MTETRDLCEHYQPKYRRGCAVGRWVPDACRKGCTKYRRDDVAILRGKPEDEERIVSWSGEFEA